MIVVWRLVHSSVDDIVQLSWSDVDMCAQLMKIEDVEEVHVVRLDHFIDIVF